MALPLRNGIHLEPPPTFAFCFAASASMMSSKRELAASRPAGLDGLHTACKALYPDQPNPLQVTALVKYWLGGPDPLDYISMYSNPGDSTNGIPPHWHYITFGLSDLHGDGRVHECSGPTQPSGFGFELTFRLKREKTEQFPPTWPAELLQSLARYVFQSENVLCVGDHVSWHVPLDHGDSSLQHMLLAKDPQLAPIETTLGVVHFVQVVAVMEQELDAAQKWNGPGVLKLLQGHKTTGGQWLVADMRRGESLFDVDPSAQGCVEEGVQRDGSNLSGVSAMCRWEDTTGKSGEDHVIDHMTPEVPVEDPELQRTTIMEQVHLQLNLEAARLLPLAIRGRLWHGRHFTYKSFAGDLAITLVCPGVQGTFADHTHPFAARGPWLQVFVSEPLAAQLLADLEPLLGTHTMPLPHHTEWVKHGLSLTILSND